MCSHPGSNLQRPVVSRVLLELQRNLAPLRGPPIVNLTKCYSTMMNHRQVFIRPSKVIQTALFMDHLFQLVRVSTANVQRLWTPPTLRHPSSKYTLGILQHQPLIPRCWLIVVPTSNSWHHSITLNCHHHRNLERVLFTWKIFCKISIPFWIRNKCVRRVTFLRMPYFRCF